MPYDLSAPWNKGVKGKQVLPLINDDAPIIRVEAGPGTRKTFGLVRRVVRKVTTVWGAKGLTAHHVFVLGLCKEAIPGIRTAEYPGTDADYYEEQRRLFYVTITRSRETLVLSRPKRIRPGDAQKLNLQVGAPQFHYSELQMCPFLRDIMDTLPTAVDGEKL